MTDIATAILAADRIEALEEQLRIVEGERNFLVLRVEELERERKYLMTTEQAMRAAADARREALEEAARVADKSEAADREMILTADDAEERDIFRRGAFKAKNIAADIRKLKEDK